MVDNFFGQQIDRLRNGRKQKDFAEWLGESPVTINSYILGTRRPGIDFLVKLREKGVNVNWFLTGEGEMWLPPEREGKPLPATNIQTLVHELTGWSTLTDDILKLVRLKKQEAELIERLKSKKKK